MTCEIHLELTQPQVNSRIIVDTSAWNRFNPNSSISVSSFPEKKDKDAFSDEDDDFEDFDEDCYDQDGATQITLEGGEVNKDPNVKPLTKDQLLLCGATVKGYSLKNKKWCM